MTKPLSEKPESDVPTPGAAKTPAVQHAAEAVASETTTGLRANLSGEGKVDILADKPINEDELKDLRNELNQHPEILELVRINAGIARAKGEDEAEQKRLTQQHVEGLARISQVFLRDAQAECAKTDMDLVRTRTLIHVAYSNAKALSAGKHQNPVALNALKDWQAALTVSHPEAVQKLVQTYARSIEAGTAAEKPDFIWLKQWIDLCTGFAPEREAEFKEKFHAAAERRCEFLMAKIEDELAKEKPDMSMVTTTIGYPPNYYVHLKPGSTVPDRIQALKLQIEARKKA